MSSTTPAKHYGARAGVFGIGHIASVIGKLSGVTGLPVVKVC